MATKNSISKLWEETHGENKNTTQTQTQNRRSVGTGTTGAYRVSGSSSGSTQQSSGYKISADTFNKYENDYANWQKTGRHTYDYSVWSNDNDYNAWKGIRDGQYKYAQVGGDIYYLDNDSYKKYGKDYDVWAKTGSHSTDYGSWGNNDGATSFRYIRDDQIGYGGLNNLKASLDDELTKAVAEKYRSQWGDKYYYDVTNYDDIAAMNAGQMPTYLRKKYKTNDPIDQYLLENGLPYSSLFSDMYSEAWQERNENAIKEQKKQQESYAKKKSIYDSVFGDISAYAKGMYDLEQDMFKGTSFQDALASGKYDALGDYYDSSFGKVKDTDTEGDKYFKSKKTSLDPVYDRAYEAIMAGKAPDDEFFDQYKESSWKSYLKQKQKWNESSFQNAFDYQAIQNAAARLEGDQNLDIGRLRAASQEDMKTAGYKIDSAYTMLDPVTITGKSGQTVVLNPVREDGTVIPKEELKRIAARKLGEASIFQSGKGKDDDSAFIASFDNRKDARAYADEIKDAARVYYGTDRDDFEERLEQAYSKAAEEQGLPQGMTVETYKEPTELDTLNSDIKNIRAEMERINSRRGRGTIPESQKIRLQELQKELDEKIGRRDEIQIASAIETSTAGFDSEKLEQSKQDYDTAESDYQTVLKEKESLDAKIAAIDERIAQQPYLKPEAQVPVEDLEKQKADLEEQSREVNNRLKLAEKNRNNAQSGYEKLQTQRGILEADAISAEAYAAALQNPDFAALSTGLSDSVKVSGSDATGDAKKIAKVIEKGTTNNFNEFYTAQQMTDEEKQTFYYLCNTKGADAGVEFVREIMPTLNNRLYREIDQKAANDAEKDGLIYSLATLEQNLGAGLMEGVPTWASSTLYRLTGGKIGRDIVANDPRQEGTRYIKRIRGEVGENIGEAHTDETGQVTDWGKALQTGYAFAMSTGDNAARLIAFGGVPGGELLSAADMYGNVFGNTVMEYMEKGASAEQAYLMGTLNAAAEAIGEAITFNEYLNVKNGAKAAAAARATGKNFNVGKYITHELIHTGTAEAWEEGVTEVLNFVFDRLVMGDDSELSQIYNQAMSNPDAKPGDGWLACIKKVAGDTFKSAGGGFLSGVLLGGFEIGGGMYQQGMMSGQEGGALANGARIMTENARLAAECEMIYKDEIEANGTAVDSSTRIDMINAISGLGLSKVQTDAIIRVYDKYAASPANILSKRSEAILRNFQKILSDAAQSRQLNGAQADVQMQKLYQKQADLWDSVLKYQQQAREALEQGNMSAHNAARAKLLEAIDKYKNFNVQAESQTKVVEIKQEQANEKAIENVKTAAEDLAENIEEETVNQTRWMQAKLADMAQGKGGEKLVALRDRLRLVERAESVAEFADQYSMEIGDQDAYQFWMDVKDALSRGEDIGDLVSKHPEYVNELYEYYNTDNIASEMVRLAGERREAEANGDQEALRNIDAQFEGMREDYGDDIVSAVINGGALNGREESNGSGTEGTVEESSVYDDKGRRIDGDQAERSDTGGIQEGETEYQPEIAGSSSGNEGEARNPVGNWNERGAVKNFRKAVADWNQKKGLQIGDNQITMVVNLSPTQSKIVRSAMNLLGGQTPFLFKSTDSGIFAGVAIGGREYVNDTGDDSIVFTIGHERAHNSRAIQDAAANTLAALGQRGEEIFNKWAEKLADETGKPVYVNGKGRGKSLNEFYSDMFGAFLYDLTTGKTVADSLGLDQSDLEEFYPAFLDQFASYAEEETEDSIGPIRKMSSVFHGGDNSQRNVYASDILDANKDQNVNMSGDTSDMLTEDGEALFSPRIVRATLESKEYKREYIDFDNKSAQKKAIEEKLAEQTKYGRFIDLTNENINQYGLDSTKKGDVQRAIRAYLQDLMKNAGLDEVKLDINGEQIVAKIRGEFPRHAQFGKNTPEKRAAIINIREILNNAEYVYSSDHDPNHSARSSKSKIDHWDIFLSPVKYGDFTFGFEIDVRQIMTREGPGEYQAYSIEERTPAVAWALNSGISPYGQVSSNTNDTTTNGSVNSFSERYVKGTEKNSKNIRVQQAQEAENLFTNGTALSDYMNSRNFDPEVAAQLRGIMLRNGQRVGGRLSDDEMEEISKDSQNWKKKVLLSLQSPVRVFKNMGRAWDNKTDEGVMRNFHASKKYSDTYYSYLSSQLQQENLYKANALKRIHDIKASENDSILAQLIGEQQIDLAHAQNAVTDGKNILIPMGDGAMVLDHKGRVRYIVDALEGFLYDDNVLKRLADQRREIEAIRKDDKPNKPDRIKQVQSRGAAPKNLSGARLEQTPTGYRIVSGNDVLYEMKNARSAYSDKARQLADELTGIYADMHGLVQRSLIENGYAPIGKIEHYFPHFSQGQEGIGQAIEYLKQEDLPIGIAGMTDTFKPGKPWARNLLSRIGDKTDYNAVRGFNNYLNSVSDVIFMTPVIQRLRQLENTLRTGMGENEANPVNTNLVTWLHEYTNGVANKKSALDRGMEAMFGRKVYQIIPKISGLAGSAYVVGNVSSALTNFGAAFQASGEMAPKYIFKGLFDTAADNNEFGDDIENAIPFLTNRLTELDQIALNSGELAKTKGMKLLTWLMGAVDGFSSKMVARAKYYECMDRGMSQEEAIKETNKYCVELFGERSKGSKPTVFNSKTLSPFTQFQLEPWNQMWHWVDIHDRNLMREYERILKQNNGVMDGIDYGKMENQINRMGVAWRDIGQILGRLIAMSIFGTMMRAVRGSDSHWNPLGFIKDAKRGYEQEGVEGIWDAAVSQAENNAPGVSALTGSYQVPALSIMKNMIDTLAGDWDENGTLLDNLQGVAKNIPEASLYAIPAGSQARKSWKGIQAYEQGGNYSPSGRLRYPIEQNVPNAIKSAIFGQSSTAPEGYRWGKDVLDQKGTEYYQAAVEEGADPQDIYQFLLNGYDAKAKQTKATKLAALATSGLTDDELDIMAQVLDIKWDGDIESAAYDALIAEEDAMEDNDKLKDSTKQKRQEAYDFYLDLLS